MAEAAAAKEYPFPICHTNFYVCLLLFNTFLRLKVFWCESIWHNSIWPHFQLKSTSATEAKAQTQHNITKKANQKSEKDELAKG